MEATPLKRAFVYEGVPLVDPDISMSPAKVKDFYAALGQYPALTNAEVVGPIEEGDTLKYEFRKVTGTKGARRNSATVKEPTTIPFVEALMAAARATGRGANGALFERAALASQMKRAVLQDGQPVPMPSALIPLLL